MESITSVERQLFILSLLSRSEKGYTITEILDQLERVGIDATRRMVARDMDSISINFFVYEEQVGNAMVYKADKYAATQMDFSMPQIISLYYIKEILKSSPKLDISKEAMAIIDKILAQMPKLSKAALDEMQGMIRVAPYFASGDKELDGNILECVRDAAAGRKRLDLKYMSFYTGEETRRLFDPYVLELRDGSWHAIGFCHKRGFFRDLRVSRIKSVKQNDESFEIPEDFYDEYKKTRFDNLAGEEIFDIEIIFTGKAARLVREYHSEMADHMWDVESDLMFCKRAAIAPDIVQWVLMFGAEAKVIKPPQLAESIAKEAAGIVAIYQQYIM